MSTVSRAAFVALLVGGCGETAPDADLASISQPSIAEDCLQAGCPLDQAGQLSCCPAGAGVACVDVSSNNSNCGACGLHCPLLTPNCVAGQCTCAGQYCSNGVITVCVDTSTNDHHCGECGIQCPVGTVCDHGACTHCCGTHCQLSTDPENCGTCGVVCPAGSLCRLGTCTTGLENDASLLFARSAPGTTELGPNMGGRLSGVVSSGASTALVSSPGGGIWKTATAGSAWSTVNGAGLGDLTVLHLERDAKNVSRLYATTWSDLYATTDDGAHWANLTGHGGMPTTQVRGTPDPRPFSQILCGDGTSRVFYARPCSGFEYSLTSGASGTFSQHMPFAGGSGNLDNCLVHMAIDGTPGAARLYFVTANVSGGAHVYRDVAEPPCDFCAQDCSLNGWELVTGGLPVGSQPSGGIAWFPYVSSISRMALIAPGAADFFAHDYYVTASSTTWTPGGELDPTNHTALLDGRALTASGEYLFYGSYRGFYRDPVLGGWKSFVVPSEHVDVRAIFPDATAGTIWTVNDGADNNGAGVNITRWAFDATNHTINQGTGIEETGIASAETQAIAVVPLFNGSTRLYAPSWDNGTFCTDTTGQPSTWLPSLASTDMIAFAAHRVNRSRGYLLSRDTSWPLRSDTLTSTLTTCDGVAFPCSRVGGCFGANSPLNHPNTLALDQRSGQEDVVALSYGNQQMELTTNGGAQWTTIPTNKVLPNTDAVFISNEISGDFVIAGTASGGVYRCSEAVFAGASGRCADDADWIPVGLNGNNGTPPARIPGIATVTSAGSLTYFAATTDGLFRKKPGQSDFQLVTAGSGYVASDVEVQPGHPQCVYVGLGFLKSERSHRGGVRFSRDGGDFWECLTCGTELHDAPVSDVEIDPSDPRKIWIATHGRGVWLLNWGDTFPAECGP